MKLHEYYKKNKFNPTTFDISTFQNLLLHRQKRHNLYVNKLSLPNRIWIGARVAEVGCSSGENTLIYAQMGARLTLIEPLKSSIETLRKKFDLYRLGRSIEKVFIDEIEKVKISANAYDVVVAEGFISTLKRKRLVVRKLFKSLSNEGFLIVATNDAVGSFLECFKAAIAQLYCRGNDISVHNDKVDAIRPFFEADFNRIPHSRPFELWAKDVLINPLMTGYPFYDFDEIVSDLKDLDPIYYSSWPTYKPANDLTWHKKITDNAKELSKALQGYYQRRMSFVLGEVTPEKEALKLLLAHYEYDFAPAVKAVIAAIQREVHSGEKGAILNAVKKARAKSRGIFKKVFTEMEAILKDARPRVYARCTMMRRFWGVPYHYIVFTCKKSKEVRS